MLSDGSYGIIEAVKAIHCDEPETTYNFEVADFHTYYVGTGVLVHNIGCGFGKYADGMEMSVDDALDAATDFLGDDYVEVATKTGNSRFISNNGIGPRQVRMNFADITGAHGRGPHFNFDLVSPKFKTIHIYLKGI